ncbi:MAG: hypothetical protein QX190_15995 [Methylococcales bacterium]
MKSDRVFLPILENINHSEFLPYPELQALQLQRLQMLLKRVIKYVPLYREHYSQHLEVVQNLHSVDDLWHLPAITKEDFINAGAKNYIDERRDLQKLICRSTSGSLGKAIDLYATPFETLTGKSLYWAGWMWRITQNDRLFCMSAPHLEFQHQFVPNMFIPTTFCRIPTHCVTWLS